MSKAKKRVRITANKTASSSITIKPHQYEKRGVYYSCFLVQGWKENGKWQRKQFKDKSDAERFAALKKIEIENQGRERNLLLTIFNEEQLNDAEAAFINLGDTYTLFEAVEYFLKHHRTPDFTISLNDGINAYLDSCEMQGTRERTLKAKQSILNKLSKELDNAEIHTITTTQIVRFLQGLRAKNGIDKITRKTWNNCRNELNHFFTWASQEDYSTNRPYIFNNPVESVSTFTAKQVSEQKKPITITKPNKLAKRLELLQKWNDGALVKYFALAYFAGIRPDGELTKLSQREKELINLETRVIHIPANISKTKEERKIDISDNLLLWLQVYADKPILPVNSSRLIKRVRKAWQLQHDETRHSFISYHVALNRSIGEAALQAGNSEGIVRKHYLNLQSKKEGKAFFNIKP